MDHDLGAGSITSLSALAILLRRPAWHRDALCREYPHLPWIPDNGARTAPCKQVCRRCLVLDECRTWALGQDNSRAGLQGIFAGLNREERHELQQGRQAA